MDAQATRAALFLLLCSGPLAEVLSANVPLLTFVQPVPFVLVTLTYGVPVLLIREVAAARGMGVAGILLLGLAYGILNEGVLAKTLTQPAGPPLYDFAGYGQVGSLQGGWTIFMVPWHALHSVLYPILICHWLFPAAANRRWFASGRARWLLAPLLVTLGGLYALYFLNPLRSDPGVFAVYAAATVCLLALALRLSAARDEAATGVSPPTVKYAWMGAGATLFYVFQFWSPGHIPFAVYASLSAATVALAVACIARAGWKPLPDLLLFGLGHDLAFALLSSFLAVIAGRHPLQAATAGIVFAGVFTWLIRGVRRAPNGWASPGRTTGVLH